jgi:uncharacterized protein (DUF952 family)
MIYHVATQKEWADGQQKGYYAPAAFAAENFIHACKKEQIEAVLWRHFYNATGLIILHIDEHFLTAPHTFVFIDGVNDEFPHIFGTINLEAVTGTTIIEDSV